ncbi:hypothetical protein [Pseudarthrobacter oxydans]|uniref:hypothetical protein n=1 Tax=Pseudarthrobacter oxydans TaxID=1671 RepID=UPI00344C1337
MPNALTNPSTGQNEDSRSPGMLEVTVAGGAAEKERTVDAAIELVTQAARRNDMGIMVTDIGMGQYVVRAHPAVPVDLVRHQETGFTEG